MIETVTKALEKFKKENKIHFFEGSTGVKNLCRICNALGYKDPMYFGQFAPNGSYGDLINFLEDNSGACDAIIEFIEEQNSEEWTENLLSQCEEEESEDDED